MVRARNVLLVGLLCVSLSLAPMLLVSAYSHQTVHVSTQARIFDSKWLFEHLVMPLVVLVLGEQIKANESQVMAEVRDRLGWTGRFIKNWMIDEAAQETCHQAALGNTESLVRANLNGTEDEIQQAIHNVEVNCAGITELYQTA